MSTDTSAPSPSPSGGLAAWLPTFRQPSPLPSPLPQQGSPEGTDSPSSPSPSSSSDPYESDSPRLAPADGDTRTRTSTPASGSEPSKADLKITGELAAGVIGIIAVAVAGVIRWQSRGRRKLRQPTETESQRIGEPVARILIRHLGVIAANADLADLLLAGGATGRYIQAGPITTIARPDPGLSPEETS